MQRNERILVLVALVAAVHLIAPSGASPGDWYGVFIDTSSISGINAEFTFDLTNFNDTLNCVYLGDIRTDSRIKQLKEFGGEHDGFDLNFGFEEYGTYMGLCDSSGGFFNSFIIEVDSLGSELGFSVEFDPTHTNTAGRRDEFAFYFTGNDGQPFVQTEDGVSNALFAISLNDDGSQDLTVYDPMQFISPDSLVLNLGDVTGATRPVIEEALAVLSVSPNPTRTKQLIRFYVPPPGGRVLGAIYDANGRLVNHLVDVPHAVGELELIWNGDTDAGHPVASGVYFLQLVGEGHRTIRKIVVIK